MTAQAEAAALARCTGAREVTVRHESRLADGSLVVTDTGTYGLAQAHDDGRHAVPAEFPECAECAPWRRRDSRLPGRPVTVWSATLAPRTVAEVDNASGPGRYAWHVTAPGWSRSGTAESLPAAQTVCTRIAADPNVRLAP